MENEVFFRYFSFSVAQEDWLHLIFWLKVAEVAIQQTQKKWWNYTVLLQTSCKNNVIYVTMKQRWTERDEGFKVWKDEKNRKMKRRLPAAICSRKFGFKSSYVVKCQSYTKMFHSNLENMQNYFVWYELLIFSLW